MGRFIFDSYFDSSCLSVSLMNMRVVVRESLARMRSGISAAARSEQPQATLPRQRARTYRKISAPPPPSIGR